jgi:hypothetical protein
MRDAVLVSVLANAGLRANEALALSWPTPVNSPSSSSGLVLGQLKTTKTGRSRTARLLAPLAADCANGGSPAEGRPTTHWSSPGHRGGPWSDDPWRYWRRRIFCRGSERRRGRTASWPLADDDAVHVRPPLRRVRALKALR